MSTVGSSMDRRLTRRCTEKSCPVLQGPMEEDAMPMRFPRRPSLTLVGAVALVLAIANPAVAPLGDLDPSQPGLPGRHRSHAGEDETSVLASV